MLWQGKENLHRIGQQAGLVLETDLVAEPQPHWRKFVQVRIDIDITKPLKPGVYLPRAGLHDVWIGLKFEKLSDLCLKCGILGHAEKECAQEKFFLTNQHGVKFPAYGEWIRSENDKVSPDIYSTKDCTETTQRVLNQKEEPPSTALGTPTSSVDTPNDNGGLSSITPLHLSAPSRRNKSCKDKLECQNAGPHVAIQVCSDSNDTHTGPILPNTHSQIIENP